jgi:hypothetical protein
VSARFQVELERDRFVPGDAVRGTVLVVEGGGSRNLEVIFEYNEETDDYSATALSLTSGTLHAGDLTAGTSFEFELSLPTDALPNHRSEHGELYWELEVKSDELGVDTHERRRIEVGPMRRTADI